MKTCFSDFGKYNYIINDNKLCPYSCCSCYIIECCCCCHCSCHLKNEKIINYPQPLTYSLMTTTTEYNTQNQIMPIKQLENNTKNYENKNKNNNKNTNKREILTKYTSLKNSNKSKNIIFLNNDILNETKNIKNEINDLKEKLKMEKENLSKILKHDYDIINERIKNKKKEIYKNKDINRNNNQNNIRNNNNIDKHKELKRIYLPENMDNIIKRKNNNVLLNSQYSHNQLSNKKQYNIDTNIDYINNKIKYNKQRNWLNSDNSKIKELDINLKNFSHKSPTLYSREQYRRIKSSYYPVNNTESSDITLRQNYSPYRSNGNLDVYSHINKNKKNNRILNYKYNFTSSYYPKNLNNNYTSYLTDIPDSKTQFTETSLFNNISDINFKNKIDRIKTKNPICFNDNIPKLLYQTRRQNFTNSYENINDIHRIKMSPLHKCGHAILSHRKYNYNIRDNNAHKTPKYKIGKDNFHNKYNMSNMNKYIRYRDIKKNSFFPSIQTNRQNEKIISLPKNNYISKSRSNEDLYKKKENKIKVNKNFLYSKKNLNNLNYPKKNTNKIQSIEINKNIINKKRVINKHNKNINKVKDIKEKNNNLMRKSRNEKNKISTNRPNLMIDNQYFSINKFNDKINNKEFKNLNKYSSVTFLKKNKYLTYSKKRKNININDKYELLKYNKNYINNANSKDEDNIGTVNSITNYISENNCDIGKSEENKLINTNNVLKKDNNKSNLLSKMHIDTNLSLDDEMDNYYKLKLNTNIEISSKTIFTIYNISNKLFILCFDFINRKFSLRDFADYGKFEENYKLSLKTKANINSENKLTDGNLFLSKGEYLYIITGKNHDMLYVYDSAKRTMNKLCSLNNNHSNGALIDFSNNNLLCISGDFNKKVELFSISKNEWNAYLSETLIERSNYAFCLIKKSIFLLFGKNYPTNEYLNTIEYYDLNNNNFNGWKYLNFKNQNNLVKMNICNGIGINYENKKIIVVGGFNGLEKKDEQYFVQVVLDDEDNFENNNSIVERTERKLKDIDKNKKYYFHGGQIISVENNDAQKNKLFYFISMDNEFNCHTIQISNLAHDVYYNC